jgi:hypothetical protein
VILMNIHFECIFAVEDFATFSSTEREWEQITVAVNKIDFWISSGSKTGSRENHSTSLQTFSFYTRNIRYVNFPYLYFQKKIFLLKFYLRLVNALGFNCFLLVIFHFFKQIFFSTVTQFFHSVSFQSEPSTELWKWKACFVGKLYAAENLRENLAVVLVRVDQLLEWKLRKSFHLLRFIT